MKPVWLSFIIAFGAFAGAASAQQAAPSAKPRAPAAAQAAAPKRIVIRAEPLAAATPAPATEPAAPEHLPSALPDPQTRIEQVRRGRRIAEIVVTPGGYSHSYVMVHREPKSPQGPVDSGTGLSVPSFVRISF